MSIYRLLFIPAGLCAVIVALCGVTAVSAQTLESSANPEKDKEEVVVLDRFVVTGSNLRQPTDALPVTTLRASQIAEGGGGANLLEVLRKQMTAFSGSGNVGVANASVNAGSTYGGSRLSLHNMPTLVLLNGRRVATNGANARGGASFVDVNQFPLAAIDRVEVLADGASAVYGADAIGGVVNVILKSDYNGSEAGGRYAFSTREGDYSEKSAYFTAGVSRGRINMMLSGNYSKNTPLFQDDRLFSSVATSGVYSGVVGRFALNPALGSPSEQVPVGPAATAASINPLVANETYFSGVTPLNLAGDVTLLTEQDQRSAYLNFTVKVLGRSLQAFGDVLYSDSRSSNQLGAQAVTFNGSGSNPQAIPSGATAAPYTPFTVNTTTASLAPSFRYVPAKRRFKNDAELVHATTGLKGDIAGLWSWESAYTYSENRLTNSIGNVLFGPNLDLAARGGYDQNGDVVAGGRYSRVYTNYSAPALPAGLTSAQAATYFAGQRTIDNTVLQPALDPFARVSGLNPDALVNVLGISHAAFESRLASFDAVVHGTAWSLPAGDVAVAAGFNYREESLVGTPDDNSQNSGVVMQRWSGGTFFDSFDKKRYVTAGYGEISLPLAGEKWNVVGVYSLDLTAAYRLEDYNDAGRAYSPKYAVSWHPLDEQVGFRYAYAQGFSAPRLYDLFGPQTQGASSDLNSTFGIAGTSSWSATTRTGSNPDLRPMTARTHSFGVVVQPKAIKGLKASIDYIDINIEGMSNAVGALTILSNIDQLGTASPYIKQAAVNNFAGQSGAAPFTAPGQISALLNAPGSTPVVANNIFISDTKSNRTAAKVQTVDVALDYILTTDSVGAFELSTVGTYFLHDRIQVLPTESFYEYAGLATTPAGAEGTIPAYRFYSVLMWRFSAWDVQVGHSYVSSVDDIGVGGQAYAKSTAIIRTRLPSYTAWDVGVGYRLVLGAGPYGVNEIKLRAGVNNFFDQMPPAAPQAFPATSAAGADTSTYSPIGRLYYVSAGLTF